MAKKISTNNNEKINEVSTDVKVGLKILRKGIEIPSYAHEGDSGMDLRAYAFQRVVDGKLQDEKEITDGWVTLAPGGHVLIKTGIAVELPAGYEFQVRPRSGLALKNVITVLNTPGTVDEGYRNEIGVILINLGNELFKIYRGDRIAQLVLQEVPKVEWDIKEDLSESDRGTDGFGSTGV